MRSEEEIREKIERYKQILSCSAIKPEVLVVIEGAKKALEWVLQEQTNENN